MSAAASTSRSGRSRRRWRAPSARSTSSRRSPGAIGWATSATVSPISRCARRVLGYEPRVALEEGLREIAEWLEGQTAVDRVADASPGTGVAGAHGMKHTLDAEPGGDATPRGTRRNSERRLRADHRRIGLHRLECCAPTAARGERVLLLRQSFASRRGAKLRVAAARNLATRVRLREARRARSGSAGARR